MSILGVQILYEFPAPRAVSDPVRHATPRAHHRIVTDGNSTQRLRTAITWATNCTLALLGAVMGLDLFLVGEHIGGMSLGISLGVAFIFCAFVFWFEIELMQRNGHTHTQKAKPARLTSSSANGSISF